MNSCVLQGVLADSNHFRNGVAQVSIPIIEFHLNRLDVLHNATHSEIALAMDLHQNKTWHHWGILAQLSNSKSAHRGPPQLQGLSSMWTLTLCWCVLISGGDTAQQTGLWKADWRGWRLKAQAQLPVSASERPKLSHFPNLQGESLSSARSKSRLCIICKYYADTANEV